MAAVWLESQARLQRGSRITGLHERSFEFADDRQAELVHVGNRKSSAPPASIALEQRQRHHQQHDGHRPKGIRPPVSGCRRRDAQAHGSAVFHRARHPARTDSSVSVLGDEPRDRRVEDLKTLAVPGVRVAGQAQRGARRRLAGGERVAHPLLGGGHPRCECASRNNEERCTPQPFCGHEQLDSQKNGNRSLPGQARCRAGSSGISALLCGRVSRRGHRCPDGGRLSRHEYRVAGRSLPGSREPLGRRSAHSRL